MFSGAVATQAQSDQKAVSLGYYGHGAIRPGLKLSLQIPLKAWATWVERKDSTFQKHNHWFIQPQLGAFGRRNFYTSYVANVELGLSRQREGRKWFCAYSVGLGYQARMEITGFTVNFSGDITDKERERRGYFMPTINYRFGRQLGDCLSLYSTLTYGTTLSTTRENAGIALFELGCTLKLSSSQAE